MDMYLFLYKTQTDASKMENVSLCLSVESVNISMETGSLNAAMFHGRVTPGSPQIEFQLAFECVVNLICNVQVVYIFFCSPDMIVISITQKSDSVFSTSSEVN